MELANVWAGWVRLGVAETGIRKGLRTIDLLIIPCSDNAALAAGEYVGFTINNSILSSTDGIIITHSDRGLYLGVNYDIKVIYVTNGCFIVIVKNISTGSLSDPVTFRFDIIKGANS